MTIQKIRSSRVTTVVADIFVGERGMIFYNESIGDLRVSDGQTPGGIPILVGGSGPANLPIATATILGGVKIGGNITITNGVISVAAPFSGNYNVLTNKPTIPTDINQLTDNSNLLVNTNVPLIIKSAGTTLTTHTSSINFTGTGVTSSVVGNDVTVTVQNVSTYNLDGGYPFSVYGGITAIDGGAV